MKKKSKKIDFSTELCTRRLYRLYRALKGHSGWRSHRLHQNPFSPYQKVFFLLRTTTFAFCPKSSTDFTLHCIARFPAANSRSKLLSNVGRSLTGQKSTRRVGRLYWHRRQDLTLKYSFTSATCVVEFPVMRLKLIYVKIYL